MPPVDIVIPFHGQYESVIECLAGIINYTPSWPYRIFFIDDASTNDKFLPNLLNNRKKAFGARLEKHLGFASAVNEGVSMGNYPLVCVMHSDVFPDNIRWLPGLVKALESGVRQSIELVSARFENAGTASDYPTALTETGEMKELVSEVAKPLPFTCCLFQRKLWDAVGPLKPFQYGWYEDIEYFHRMKKIGLKQGIAQSVVRHAGGRTIKSLFATNPLAHGIMKGNATRCREEILKAKK